MASCTHVDKRRIISVDSIRDTTVDLIVGEAQKKFMVHKFLLCQTASYFQAALEGSFKEATEQKITMPEQSPEVIERFVLWVYTGKLLGSNEEATTLNRRQLADLYIVGDIYGIPDLQNSVMDSFVARMRVKKSSRGTKVPVLHHVYENTPRHCCLQRFLTERAAAKCDFSQNSFEEKKDEYPQQHLIDLVREFHRRSKLTSNDIDWKNLRCRYHIHPGDVVKSAEGHSDTSLEEAAAMTGSLDYE